MPEKLSTNHIDGPMLPQLHPFTSSPDPLGKPRGNTSLVPTITPPSHPDGRTAVNEQYLLVPNSHSIVVRSIHHGRRVCVLIPDGERMIRSMSLLWIPDVNDGDSDAESDDGENNGEWVILAGCQDGSIHEWTVSSLSNSNEGVKPRRIFQLESASYENALTNLEILHIASPESKDEGVSKILTDMNKGSGSLLFALVQGKSKDESSTWLTRCLIPPYKSTAKKEKALIHPHFISCVKYITDNMSSEELFRLQSRHLCLKEGDDIFGFLAAFRPNDDSLGMETGIMGSTPKTPGDLFVAMCSSYGLIVYHEEALPELIKGEPHYVDIECVSLVHFTGATRQHIAHLPPDLPTISSMAISPDVKDIVLGRSDGQINLLDDIFDCIKEYLGAFNNKLKQMERSESGECDVAIVRQSLKHPHTSIVRRNVHWHTHPAIALAFMAASTHSFASMTKTLISGGEENVLATWQLDRNFHRPTHFLARISQGGIIHVTCCQYSGRIVICCSDNSIHCYNGSNYERVWLDQGLALAPQHREDEMSGGIVMIKDPVTSFLIMSNLPGAPGQIHWFDPRSKSVVGVLEASPYNRITRRDRDNDPHLPVPEVTHMAIGRNGKDLVTVDRTWTENLHVGSPHNLVAPDNTLVPMNVCTSIKFWVYKETSKADQPLRKRSNTDTSMNYELVSSMSAPHGRNGSVCGLDVAAPGNVACTLSKEENAFRVWVKNTTTASAVLWKCLYKVKTPSGFSNMLAAKGEPSSCERLVSFSSDGSVLSVCYGSTVTLWDHSNATLLTSLAIDDIVGGGQSKEDIQQVHFMNKTDDTLLVTTKNHVFTKSPFGGGVNRCYLGNDEWTFDASYLGAAAGTEGVISSVIPLPGFGESKGAGGFFATTINDGRRSIISIVNREKGELQPLSKSEESPIQWTVDGEVQTLCLNSSQGSAIELLAITKDCNMLSLKIETEKEQVVPGVPVSTELTSVQSQSKAPVLKFAAENEEEPPTKRRKISIVLNQRSKKSHEYAGCEFPALSGKFTMAFIAKNLGVSLH